MKYCIKYIYQYLSAFFYEPYWFLKTVPVLPEMVEGGNAFSGKTGYEPYGILKNLSGFAGNGGRGGNAIYGKTGKAFHSPGRSILGSLNSKIALLKGFGGSCLRRFCFVTAMTKR